MPPQAAAASTVINRRGSILDQDTRSVFDRIDEDASGNIDKRELRKGLREMGIRNVTPEQLDMFYQKYARSSPAGMTYDEFDALMQTVKKHLKSLGLEVHPQVLPGQDWVREVYNMPRCMYSVAALIVISFGCNILEKEIDPSGEQYKSVWEGLDTTFNILFLFELLVNMYGSWRKPFFRVGWNYFDMFVVAIGILILVRCPMPGPLSLVLMLRTLRVFRIFGRVESLKRILRLIAHSLPYHLNACSIMLLVVCIYAVLAVDLYAQTPVVISPDPDNPDLSARGERYSKEYYGTFLKSMYTLFQILTGESWSEMGVRPILEGSPDVSTNIGVALFFCSFVLINSVVLLNVVVAVLLNGMAEASDAEFADFVDYDPELDGDDDGPAAADGDDNGVKDVPNDDHDNNDDDVMLADLDALKKQVDTMSVEIKEVLSGLRSLEEQQQ